jgi:L-ascorbate metabolism protein UlaG (beta-lactamase superfamily)
VEDAFRSSGLLTHILEPWTERQIGPFRITAAPAVDGVGDPQRTYIVEAGGFRILHAGDTMNHGYWWAIAQQAGPIDVAFMPINAPVVNLPHLQPPSPFHAVMSPEEAVVAATILGASTVVPIHYGDIKVPNAYEETENHISRFKSRAEKSGVRPYLPPEGEWFPAGGRG